MFPIERHAVKVAHLYGVITNYHPDKGELEIMDETRQYFQLYINVVVETTKSTSKVNSKQHPVQYGRQQTNTSQPQKQLPLNSGDIIRIHRLGLFPDFSRRCPYAKNVMVCVN